MFRLRSEAFSERLGWEVEVRDGLECDDFDRLGGAYIVAKAPDNSINGCWRLLPTTGPYMLRDTFAPLLHGQPAPVAENVWEMSRFAVARGRVASTGSGFGPLSVRLMAESLRFALDQGITRYVTVTTVSLERLLVRLGIHLRRIGPPHRIGIAMAVACVIEVDRVTLDAVGLSPPAAP